MITVSTGFSPQGYIDYGRVCLETFNQFWPIEIGLQCYVEHPMMIPRSGYRTLWACEGLREFLMRHEYNLEARGKKQREGWGAKHVARGYCYRFDAHKFCRQCFIPEQAAKKVPDGDILVWLDGDVVTIRHVPEDLVDRLIADVDACYLGRNGTYSEIGFWAVRLSTATRLFLFDLAELYRSDEIFRLPEWHSAYAFDHIRKQHDDLKWRNLVPDIGTKGNEHVWFRTELGRYMDHLKGDARKRLGRSPERI